MSGRKLDIIPGNEGAGCGRGRGRRVVSDRVVDNERN